MLAKLRKKRKLGRIIRRHLNQHLNKRADLFREVCFQEIPVTFKTDFDWYGQSIPKGSMGTIKAVDPVESVFLIDVEVGDTLHRVTDFIENIIDCLKFKNKEDSKYLKETIDNIPWTQIVYD